MEVLKVGDPEDGRNLITGQEAGRPSGEHTEVPYIVVVGLYTIILQSCYDVHVHIWSCTCTYMVMYMYIYGHVHVHMWSCAITYNVHRTFTITNPTLATELLTIITIITNHKVGVSFNVIGHVALENEVVNTMCSDGSVVGVVYGAVLDVGPVHGTTQVEVDGITTKPEGLASISKLRMVNPDIEK